MLAQKLCFIGIIWKDFYSEILPDLNCNPKEFELNSTFLAERIIQRKMMNNHMKENLIRFAEGNLLLLSIATELYDTKTISFDDLVSELPFFVLNNLNITDDFTSKKILYLLSLLGKYEIDATADFITTYSDTNNIELDNLLLSKKIRKRGEAYTLGHKTYCKLIHQALYLDTDLTKWFRINKSFINSADVLLQYLTTLKPDKIFSILKKLYKNANPSLSHKQEIIIYTWQSIDYIVEKLLWQQEQDPTWNNTLSSVMFAVKALCSVGYKKNVSKSIEYVRSLYNLENFDIDLTTEANNRDFKFIKAEIIKQDENEVILGEKGCELDENKFYENWVKGVVLCTEAYYNADENRIIKLSNNVVRLLDNKNYFYPERVPWCTSRILIGLGQARNNISNNEYISKVANWLLNHPNYQNAGYWISGTGSWNNWLEATSLAIISLLSVGVPKSNPIIQAGVRNLFEAKSFWIEKNKELDGVVALQAYALAGGDLIKVIDEINPT